ncbi:MAG: NADH-quinone oxidoreductase subunit C [Candidatus Calescibacterium sp.]|nr:NADH-quinone oxidoreductase subunit C [Candidatus Calescibacterium sp.]MDW8133068.1 NADH-quinone oxidoreductase subunit C [Candidatus Calescibacterium sp.]
MFLWNLEGNRQKYSSKVLEKRIEILESFKQEIAEKLLAKYGEVIVIPYGTVDWLSRNYPIVIVKDPKAIRNVVEYIKMELGFNYLNYITAVDYYLHNVFHVVYEFTKIPVKDDSLAVENFEFDVDKDLKINLNLTYRLRLIVPIDRDNPEIDSIEDIYRTADWHERETYDFFGIVFKNRKNVLEKILMPNEWEGFPLRKDFFHERIIPHPFVEAYYVVKRVKELKEEEAK